MTKHQFIKGQIKIRQREQEKLQTRATDPSSNDPTWKTPTTRPITYETDPNVIKIKIEVSNN